MSLVVHPSMEDLPVLVMVDILSRLPVKSIIHCKCVCKKWLDLISDSYFANLHLSRSPASLMIQHNIEFDMTGYCTPGTLTWVELEDELDHYNLHDDSMMSLDLNLASIFQETRIVPVGSVNGLLCLWQIGQGKDNTYICNPITREYMILPSYQCYRQPCCISVTCFGVSSLTREYKVMRIFRGNKPPDSTSSSRSTLLEAEVYTLGTGQWRSLGHVPYWLIGSYGRFFNGHAHCIVVGENSPEKICAFDFDKEAFELFPSPPPPESRVFFSSLGIINGCLCQCDSYESKSTVWVMKEYGIKKSWHKELVIQQSISYDLELRTLGPLYPIDSFRDGAILMGSYSGTLFVYCPRRKTILDMEKVDSYFSVLVYRPSFHRLHNFENERVHVFEDQQ